MRNNPRQAKIQGERDSLEESLEAYLAHLQLERGASPATLDSYEGDLRQFLEFLRAKKITDCRGLSIAPISAYLAHLTTLDLKPASAARKITSLRTFLRFLFVEQLIHDDFTERISTPRQRRKLPETLALAQFEKLLEAIPDTVAGLRDRAIVELMFGSGLRVSEVCGLRLTDIDEEAGFLRIFGKGSKERIVPLGNKALLAIKHYTEISRPHYLQAVARPFKTHVAMHSSGGGNRPRTQTKKLKTPSILFIGERGGALARCSIWYSLKVYARRAGIPENLVHPHMLRHSFATELLKGGADLRLIQGMLGHSSISTTQIYTAVEPTQLIKTHEKYHPRSRMKI